MNSISLYGVNSIDLYQLLRLRHPRRNLAVVAPAELAIIIDDGHHWCDDHAVLRATDGP